MPAEGALIRAPGWTLGVVGEVCAVTPKVVAASAATSTVCNQPIADFNVGTGESFDDGDARSFREIEIGIN